MNGERIFHKSILAKHVYYNPLHVAKIGWFPKIPATWLLREDKQAGYRSISAISKFLPKRYNFDIRVITRWWY